MNFNGPFNQKKQQHKSDGLFGSSDPSSTPLTSPAPPAPFAPAAPPPADLAKDGFQKQQEAPRSSRR